MKIFKILIISVLFIFYLPIVSTADNSITPGKLIVKFKKDSELGKRWMQFNRKSDFKEFENILGEHQSRGFIRDAVLKAVGKKFSGNMLLRNNTIVESLSRICLIEFSSPIDPRIAARKISTFPGVEFAEPLPQETIDFFPNDTLLYAQYYLARIKAFDAWDEIDTTQFVVIGVVDTGVDYDHEDLKKNIYINPGEDGFDDFGNEKRTNGIDDDDNGFVDDWQGWDFVSSTDTSGSDNDPYPGHEHGTHVSGIAAAVINNEAGIAGVAIAAKILPVKIGDDNPWSTSVSNSYEGILYAASMGADVINCSWGSSSKSQAEEEILTTASNLGSVIVAAAGNDGKNIAFYPSSHNQVLSVAAVNESDRKATFSNYHRTVDVSAPGVNIYSTIPGNYYTYMDGTSMASPVVTGVAALVRLKNPDYTPLQVIEHIKATTDNIDSLNPYYGNKMGRGRVNAFKAVSTGNLKSIILKDYKIIDENEDGVIDENETVKIDLTLLNVLSPIKNGNLKAVPKSYYKPDMILDSSYLGDMSTLEEKTVANSIEFKVPKGIPTDYSMEFELRISDENGYCNSETIELILRPSYRTMDANNISVTFNSRGNIAFNDYPGNFQGIGYTYKESPNILFEGALMVAVSPTRVSNVARGYIQMDQDKSFYSDDIFHVSKPGSIAAQEGNSMFNDLAETDSVGVSISQKVYQFNDELNKDIIFLVYDIVNQSGEDFDSLYAGLFFDWDIGPGGDNNIAVFDNSEGFGFVENIKDTSLPFVGAEMLSFHKLNFFAIDNNGSTSDNPGIYDGYSRSEKWTTLSSGIYRKQSSITDVSIVIGAGPIQIKNGDTTRVAFSLFSSYNRSDLQKLGEQSRITAKNYGIADGEYNPLPNKDEITRIYPNPAATGNITVDFGLLNGSYISLEIYDLLGRRIYTAIEKKYYTAGQHYISFQSAQLPQGVFFARLSTVFGTAIETFQIIR